MTERQSSKNDMRVTFRSDDRYFRLLMVALGAGSALVALAGPLIGLDRTVWIVISSFLGAGALYSLVGVLWPHEYEISICDDVLSWGRSDLEPMGTLARSQLRSISFEAGLDSDETFVELVSGTYVSIPSNLVAFARPTNVAALVARHWPEVDITIRGKKWTAGEQSN